MAVLEILLFQITNKTNQTLPYITNLEPPSLTLPGGHQRLPSGALKLKFQHVVPDVLIKKLPKIVKIKSGTAKAELRQSFSVCVYYNQLRFQSNYVDCLKPRQLL